MHINFYECVHSHADLHRHDRDLKSNIKLLSDPDIQKGWKDAERERAASTISNLEAQRIWVAGQLLAKPEQQQVA